MEAGIEAHEEENENQNLQPPEDDKLLIEYLKQKVAHSTETINDLKFELMICNEVIKSSLIMKEDANNNNENNCNENFRVEIENLKSENVRLAAKNRDLELEIDGLSNSHRELTEKVQKLEAYILTLEADQEVARKNLKNSDDKHENVQKEFDEFRKEVDLISDVVIKFLSDKVDLNAILKGNLDQAGSRFEKLSMLINVLDADCADINLLLSAEKIKEFKRYLDIANGLAESMEKLKAKFNTSYDSIVQKLENSGKNFKIIEARNLNLQSENKKLSEQIKALQGSISILRVDCREFSSEVRQKDKVIEESKKQISNLIDEKREIQKKATDTDLENSTYKMRLNILEDDIKLRDREIEYHVNLLRRMEKTELQVKSLQKLCEVEKGYSMKLKEYSMILHDKLMKERKKFQEHLVKYKEHLISSSNEHAKLIAERDKVQKQLDNNLETMGENLDRLSNKLVSLFLL